MKKYILTVCVLAAILSCCNKYDGVTSPDSFQVTTARQTYKVGDSVIFNFNTGPDQITFWSGENGKKYENRQRNLLAGNPVLVFQTAMQQGLLANPDSLKLYISTNLKGYDSTSVAAASWTDLTARNTKWPKALSTSFTTSDSISLSDFNNAAAVNIAFRAIGSKYATAAQRKWQLQNLVLTNFLPDGTSSVLFNSFANTGWVQASLKNNATPGFMAWNVGTAGISASNSITNTSGITIRSAYPVTFDPGTATNVDENDDWLITSAIDLKQVKPDVGVTIKNDLSAAYTGLTYVYDEAHGVYARYQYIFRTAGTYNVTFVANDLNGNKRADVVRTITITITP